MNINLHIHTMKLNDPKKSVTYTLKPFIALLDKYEYSIDELDDVEIANYTEVASTSQTTPLIINDLSNIFRLS